MNIAIIGSGGDGAGMNQCLYELCKRLKKHNITLFYRGYQGLIDNTVATYSLNFLKEERTKGGIIIKSSRSPEFMTEKGYKKALKNLKENNVDLLIVMGGNGSLQGVKKLASSGVKCIFIPTTIDNDIAESDYCIGFDTAVNNAVDFVTKVDTSMQAFDRTCIYEVMGRHCPDIANAVAKLTCADYCYTDSSTKEDMLKNIKKALKVDLSPKVILQENVIDANELKTYLQDNLKGADVKVQIVGYVQRGGYATKKELFMATEFAIEACRCIKLNKFNQIISYNEKDNNFIGQQI
ncbi:MAG: 6-phosphofructokinase [Clostridia bacterium]|nr:6-phosphofructokinase [Clostridia bacterium]